MKTLGIDLGTASTYMYSLKSGQRQPAPLVMRPVTDDAGSAATVTLYENGAPVLAGNVAEAEFYSQPQLQGHRRLASQFKPEIGLGEVEALKAATDFLAIMRANLPEGTLDSQTALSVGIPALAREDFRIRLGKCFQDAGWPTPEFVRESDAALVSCLQAGALHVNDLERKSLILDFGGGTCDFTTVERLDALQNGGDILYGGRLFDDLFYQAFCRSNPDFAREAPTSPFAWHAHWLECRNQKEIFSKNIASNPDGKINLRMVWHDASGTAREAWLREYTRDAFLTDAENYRASAELLELLEPYKARGGLSAEARDLLAGRAVGLIAWLKNILVAVDNRRDVAKVILTGGSCRWFFVEDLVREIFPGAGIVASQRGYEDIAYGLALFPLLTSAREKTAKLLEESINEFSSHAIRRANALVEKQARAIASLCSERIVERDIMPVLEAAQKEGASAAALEERFSENIRKDAELKEIVAARSNALRQEIEQELNYEFRNWLAANGVPLAPKFDFPARVIGQDFLKEINIRVSRLYSLNLMGFTLQNILPIIAATATAGAIIHAGEPVSAAVGGGAAFGATWLVAKVAPKFLENRRLPPFLLNESNRKKIVEKNREHIDQVLQESFTDFREQLASDIERRFHETLSAMLASLTALNQIKTG